MKKLYFLYHTSWQFTGTVTDHYFALRSTPRTTSAQKITMLVRHIEPRERFMDLTDGFGNRLLVGCYPDPHDHFTYEVSGIAQVDQSREIAFPCHPMYRYPTPLTAADAAVTQFLWEVHPREEASPVERACILMQALFERFRYVSGSTGIYTTAGQALSQGMGVCQDYAHILIALCRQAGVPARYVAGMMIGEGATHAWMEVHDGERWVGLDPTHNRFVDDGYIDLSHGRDYRDCILDRGVFSAEGNVRQTQIIHVSVSELP